MIDCRSIRWCFIVDRVTLVGVNRRDAALAALVAALWGFNFVVIDWGMGSVPPLLFAAIRFTLVAVPACFLVPRPPVPFRTVAAVGAFMSLGQFGFLYLSMHLGMPPGLAALVLSARSHAARPDVVQGLELDVIASVTLGGCSLFGGRGFVLGTLLGSLIIGTLNNGLVLLGVSSSLQLVIKGAIIVAAVAFTKK